MIPPLAVTNIAFYQTCRMESMFRWLLVLLALVAAAFGGLYVAAGRATPPRLTIDQPGRFVGQSGALDVTAEAPNAVLSALTITLEQNGKQVPLFTLDGPQTASVTQIDRNHLKISRALGKQSVPELT